MLYKIYLKLPFILQGLMLNIKAYIIKRYRYNNEYYEAFEAYRKSDRTKIHLNAFQQFLIEAKNSGYWHKKFIEYEIDTSSPNPLREIEKLPILTKSEVQRHMDSLMNKELNETLSYVSTSGTTGSSLVFPQTQSMENHQWAIWWRYRSWHGIKMNTWMAWFGGRSIINIDRKSSPFWHKNFPMKQLMFSAHHLSSDTVGLYYDKLKEEKISWIHGYPSQISLFAQLLDDCDYPQLTHIKMVTLGSENLLENQKEIIQKVFEAKVVQHYGLAEGVANISEQKDGQLNADQDFSYVEFIPINEDQPRRCKIIGTNYRNAAFPLIRYDTGDIASIDWSDEKLPIILSIDGRAEDYIVLNNGVKLGRLDHIFKELHHIKEAQIYQSRIGEVELRVVKRKSYNIEIHEKDLREAALLRFGTSINIKVKYLTKISRSKSGKFKFVVSDISESRTK
jgi:phenylacetate-CoA ligase